MINFFIDDKSFKIFDQEIKTSSKKNSKTKKPNFNIHNVYNGLMKKDKFFSNHAVILEIILNKNSKKYSKKILLGLIRFSFLCQPVLDKAASTAIYQTRWDIPKQDSRFADKETCNSIFNFLFSEICELLLYSQSNIDLLIKYINYNACPYDLPIDYKKLDVKKIHSLNNINVFKPSQFKTSLILRDELRNFLKQKTTKAALNKVKIATYYTERGITGDNKSNRELRWETITMSPLSARKKDCWEIECKLLEQIIGMKGLSHKKLPSNLNYLRGKVTMCPVLLLPINLKDFEFVDKENRGNSLVHLGHITPKSHRKKAHTKQNVSWISFDGNKMQGNSSIKDFHNKILKLAGKLKKQILK